MAFATVFSDFLYFSILIFVWIKWYSSVFRSFVIFFLYKHLSLQATLKRNLFAIYVVVDFVTALNDHIDFLWNIQSLLICIKCTVWFCLFNSVSFSHRIVLFIKFCIEEDFKCFFLFSPVFFLLFPKLDSICEN